MASTDNLILGSINYYCQAKYYRHLQNVCLDGLRKHGSDPVLIFWKAFGILMEDRVSEGIRELEAIQDKQEVILCSLMALIYAHKKAKMIDKESVQQLEARLKQTRTSCGENALYFAGMFLWHTGRHDKAREYVDRMLKMSSGSKEGAVLRGWIDLTSARDSAVKKSVKFFDEALQGSDSSQSVDAFFGKAKYLVMKNNFSLALEMINQVVVMYPEFEPALVEKMKIQLALQDWEQTIDVAQRCLSLNRYSLEAHKMIILSLLCREGKYHDAADAIGELIQYFDRHEPKSHSLYYEAGQLFSRVCGHNTLVLQQTFELVARAQSLSETSAEYATELGNQLVMQKRVRDAMKSYRTAMNLDETSVPALTGIIRCQLLENMIDDAEQQLEFLNEIQQSIGKSAELSYLGAVLARKKEKKFEKVVSLLNECTDIHFKKLQGIPLGSEYYFRLNPEFLLQVVEEYLIFAPNELQNSGQPASPMLKRCAAVLDPLTKAAPGLLQGLYLMAKVRYLSGDIELAKTMLAHCLEQHDRFSDAHLLMAQIHLKEGNHRMADQSLEVGLSYNFEVREAPLYHLIKARVHKNSGNPEECIKTLNTAMGLPGVKKAIPNQGGKKANSITLSDRVSVYLELANAHCQLDHTHEAAKIMQDAMNEFSGTSEEVRVSIANADLFLKRGDVNEALTILRSVTPEQSYFIQAREKMADIYLNHRKDKRLYASCYRELVDKHPSPHTSLLLGDAYMSIQEPEQAIEVYEAALKRNPRDSTLASRIGQALIRTHNYNKAINYYEVAVKTGNQGFLRYDLAELHMKMKNYEKAEKVITTAMEEQKGADLASLMQESKLLVLLSKIHKKSLDMEENLNVLTRARDVQIRVLKRVGIEQPDQVPIQKLEAAQICCDMAELATSKREYDQAIKSYREALSYDRSHSKAMVALAKLHLLVGDLDACQLQCTRLLEIDKDNDAAFLMMAELKFRKHDYESAMFHFQQLLERKPDQYEALGRLLDLLRRAGNLEECDKFLEQAERSPRADRDAGLNYCKGMSEWYKNNPTQALKCFNLARKDSEWGERATYNMIEICLNPDNETLGGETFEGVDADLSNQAEKYDSQLAAVRTAEKLLKEVKPKGTALRYRVLETYALMANKNKSNIEKALSQFMEIVTTERDHIPSLLGMATAYMYLKQTPRARNQLKRIAKMNWTMEEAEEFERSWLLLADVYIQSGKYDMAGDLLKKCLEHNKSCCKAWEYMGFIMEKEQAYKDAAKNYENAWKFGNQNNPGIGFKLAFNYLKAKRFVDAIDVCHKVLAQHPKYPRIRKEILEKARCSIRT